MIEIKEINLAVNSEVRLSEGDADHEDLKIVRFATEDGPENCKMELAISEKFSEDGFVQNDVECIEYDEALRRIGGFGGYQILLFWAASIFSIYGD